MSAPSPGLTGTPLPITHDLDCTPTSSAHPSHPIPQLSPPSFHQVQHGTHLLSPLTAETKLHKASGHEADLLECLWRWVWVHITTVHTSEDRLLLFPPTLPPAPLGLASVLRPPCEQFPSHFIGTIELPWVLMNGCGLSVPLRYRGKRRGCGSVGGGRDRSLGFRDVPEGEHTSAARCSTERSWRR